MPLRDGDKKNFETLQRAFANGDACLIECETKDGQYVAVICARTQLEDGGVFLSPFARMFLGDPYEEVIPPVDPLPERPSSS